MIIYPLFRMMLHTPTRTIFSSFLFFSSKKVFNLLCNKKRYKSTIVWFWEKKVLRKKNPRFLWWCVNDDDEKFDNSCVSVCVKWGIYCWRIILESEFVALKRKNIQVGIFYYWKVFYHFLKSDQEKLYLIWPGLCVYLLKFINQFISYVLSSIFFFFNFYFRKSGFIFFIFNQFLKKTTI